jgi:hypothetical protein
VANDKVTALPFMEPQLAEMGISSADRHLGIQTPLGIDRASMR